MKRTTVSSRLMDRIVSLLEDLPSARTVTVGPAHNPTAALVASVDVRSALGRFLTKKHHVNRQLGADQGSCYTTASVRLRRSAGAPRLELFVVSVC